MRRRRDAHLGPRVRLVWGASPSRAADRGAGARPFRPGGGDGRDDADLAVGGALGRAVRLSRHALASHSQGSGGSASRIVTGRSVVAGQCHLPRPDQTRRDRRATTSDRRIDPTAAIP
jgi:hypothetical protein